jgi:hypothetical protein
VERRSRCAISNPQPKKERPVAREQQLTPVLFHLKALTRQVEDTHNALGIDLYNGCRALYKAIKPIALINGVADLIARIGQRFARQGRRKATPKTVSTDSGAQ